MINGGWDALQALFVAFFWIETKGLTLEEIDRLIDGVKHTDMPDLEDIKNGNAVVKGLDVDSVRLDSVKAGKIVVVRLLFTFRN